MNGGATARLQGEALRLQRRSRLLTGIGALLFLLVLARPIPMRAAVFEAAVAKVDITPPPGLPMYGFFDRIKDNKLSTGTLDPLYARVLILAVGKKRLALVTLDLGRTFNEALLNQLRENLKATAGVCCVIVTASHTHSGPNILDEYRDGQTPAWEMNAIGKITAAVSRASRHLVPARLGVGRGQVEVGYNRRQVQANGTIAMLWSDPDQQPSPPVDPTVMVIRIDDLSGRPLAILVNYACHPVVLGSDNLKYSADFVGVMASTVEKAFAGTPLCLFLQGGDGDINPYYATTALVDGAVAKREWTGQQLGNEAVRVAKAIQPSVPAHPAIDFADDVLSFRLRWQPRAFRQGLLDRYGPRIFEDHADLLANDPPPDRLNLHVTTLLLNKEIALAGMPGEPFVNLQVDWRARCPVSHAVFLGYANGYFDYLPTIEAAAEGGYGAGDSNTYVEVGAGERMLRQSLVRIYEMQGKLSDAPERQ